MRKESELCRKPFEKELRELDLLLENSVLSRRDSLAGSVGDDASDDERAAPQALTNGHDDVMDIEERDMIGNGELSGAGERAVSEQVGMMNHVKADVSLDKRRESVEAIKGVARRFNGERTGSKIDVATEPPDHQDNNPSLKAAAVSHPQVNGVDDTAAIGNPPEGIVNHGRVSSKLSHGTHAVPPTPPLSSEGDPSAPLSHGGIPWYMDPFDPTGTTIHEERWTGRDVVRGMSEELSDMDEEELQGLVDEEMAEAAPGENRGDEHVGYTNGVLPVRRKNGGKRRRWRGFR